MMTSFWIYLIVLLVVAVALVWFLGRRVVFRGVQQDNDRQTQNIIIFKQRLTDYQNDLERGDITQDQFDELKIELDKTLLDDAGDESSTVAQQNASYKSQTLVMMLVLMILVPVLALTIYSFNGASNDVRIAEIMKHPPKSKAEAMESMEELVERLEVKVAKQPEDMESAFLLARYYMTLKKPDDAAAVFMKISEKLPNDNPEKAYILGQYAQALYFRDDGNGGKMTPAIKRAVNEGLQINPREPSILGLMGVHSFDSGEYREAIRHWRDLLKALPPGRNAESIKSGIKKAEEKLLAAGETLDPIEDGSGVESNGGESEASLKVAVELSEALKSKVKGDEAVFILARIPGGPKMPLAVKKLTVNDLPTEITLSDSDAMGPMAKLSSVEEAEIVARISMKGTPQAQAGDFEGVSQPVKTKKHNSVITLIVDQVIGEEVNSPSVSASTISRSEEVTNSDGNSLKILVELSEDLAEKVAGDETVFVLARAHNGSRMPLVVKRFKASDLPLEVSLSDSDAMSPMGKLSSAPEVEVVARISKSGDAMPKAGDLEGVSGPVQPAKQRSVTSLLIDKVVN